MNKRTRYLIFVYDDYYPSGGMRDCIGGTDSVEECIGIIDNYINNKWSFDWAELFDTTNGNVFYPTRYPNTSYPEVNWRAEPDSDFNVYNRKTTTWL